MMTSIFVERDWPETYGTREPAGQPNWAWLYLWEQENPNPGAGPNYEYWSNLEADMDDRIWVAWFLPQFRVFDWDDQDVQDAYRLLRGHVCGVCGRSDDAGCVLGC